jgi:tellurite methyltransferase
MAYTDRERWDRRYHEPRRSLKHKRPNDLLVRFAPPPRPGIRALELACGLGHNALWLAAQGYTVDAIDISLTALRRARHEMLRRGLNGVNFIQADLDHFPLPDYAYDLVYVFRFLDRDLFPSIRERVRPGGIVIYSTLNVYQQSRRRMIAPEHILTPGELPRFFPGWDMLEAGDDDGRSHFAGRKPAGIP